MIINKLKNKSNSEFKLRVLKGMAFVCPYCKKETLSRRSAEIKVCLECWELVDLQNLIEMLKKMGVQKETIDKVRSDIKTNIVTERTIM